MMPKVPTKKVVEEAVAALDSVRREWLRRPGVTAVDVGFKIEGDKMTDSVAIRVHVARKIAVAELASSEVFNETGKTPKKVKGFPVDVIEAKYGPSAMLAEPMALDDADEEAIAGLERTTALDPLIGGISCGNGRVTAGTIGAVVFDRRTCRPMILSNWHVLAGASAAAVGEGILQPGQVDGGTQVVATLTRMRLNARMDAAVATLNGARGHARDILGCRSTTAILAWSRLPAKFGSCPARPGQRSTMRSAWAATPAASGSMRPTTVRSGCTLPARLIRYQRPRTQSAVRSTRSRQSSTFPSSRCCVASIPRSRGDRRF
jgi:hypothetical protein